PVADIHIDEAAWNAFFAIREQVNTAFDEAKKDKVIGSSIAATLTAPNLDDDFAASLSEPWEQLFIVANVKHGDAITIQAADGIKCPRCWNFGEPAHPEHAQHNELCPRCFAVVADLART
ncbi:MAG: isoleucine--tRNA ligase, partial [Mariprofundus sp.]|nr:isoleucine--tRNA ligase [Mariprofundus sp.]